MTNEVHFRAMGTVVHLISVGGDPDILDRARARIADLEARWSRFLPSSEVSRLNAAGGDPTVVSSDTIALVRVAVRAWRDSRGLFDPTVLPALLAAGYDRSFDSLPADVEPTPSTPAPVAGCEEIAIDAAAGTVTLPPGAGFDAGGIGKGYAADLVVAEMLDAGARGACASMGGDVRVVGDSPEGEGWVVAIEHPFRREPVATARLEDGAVATSARTRRSWMRAGLPVHHVIDPVTSEPAWTGIAQATAITTAGWRAEALAKAAFISGAGGFAGVLAAAGATGLVVTDDGEVVRARGMERLEK